MMMNPIIKNNANDDYRANNQMEINKDNIYKNKEKAESSKETFKNICVKCIYIILIKIERK